MGSDEIPLAEIANALSSSEDRLYEDIARTQNLELGIKVGDLQTLIRQGKAWWNEKGAALRPSICGNSLVKRVANSTALDIAQAVYVAIWPDVGSEAAVYACALIAKTGIASWCDAIWRNE